jgi:phosphatidylserine/phosphatidylglycerophosphate/cardiolipin synthase-like enzyme
MSMRRYLLLFALIVVGCADVPAETEDDDPDVAEWGGKEDAPLPRNATGVIEVHALDVWGQALPRDARLTIRRAGKSVAVSGWPVARFAASKAGRYQLQLRADGYRTMAFVLAYDGAGGVTLASSDDLELNGLALGQSERDFGTRTVPVASVFTGLSHRYFSSQGRPARRGNSVRLMTSGEEAWREFAKQLRAADDHIHIGTWVWQSDFELERSTNPAVTEAARRSNTVMSILEASPAQKRVLVNQIYTQDGFLSNAANDAPLRAHGARTGDGFEFMGEANPTKGRYTFTADPTDFAERLLNGYAASYEGSFDDVSGPLRSTMPTRYVDLTQWPITVDIEGASTHQKFAAMDGTIAFVGGMNIKLADWDTDVHAVFDVRRMAFDSSTADRQAVAAHDQLPDSGPRKDYMVRLEGPIVEDVEQLFQERWDHLRQMGVEYSENTTPFEHPTGQRAVSSGIQAQLTATMPAPYDEHAIGETWFNAVAAAEHYIYIEDQYFRIPMLVDAIAERMRQVPELQLVVITKPINEYVDTGCKWTYETATRLISEFPQRFHHFQLRTFDTQNVDGPTVIYETESRFADMDTHSKMFIVDDVFMSVGSANKNNRGILYEAELNVAIYDQTWVSAQRRRILGLILPAGVQPEDDADGWITQLELAAASNATVYRAWEDADFELDLDGDPLPADYQPSGMVYPLLFDDPSECLIEAIGPDQV